MNAGSMLILFLAGVLLWRESSPPECSSGGELGLRLSVV